MVRRGAENLLSASMEEQLSWCLSCLLYTSHGVSVLVYLDETLSYIWTITCLHPRASIMEYHQSHEVWCGHYEACLEAGLQAALRLM